MAAKAGRGTVAVGGFLQTFGALTFVTETSVLPAVADWLILNICAKVTTNQG